MHSQLLTQLKAWVKQQEAETKLYGEMVEAANMMATTGRTVINKTLVNPDADHAAEMALRFKIWEEKYYEARNELDKVRRGGTR